MKKGQMMIIGLIFLMVVLILAAALFSRVAGYLRFGSNSILREQATNLAEAGIDRAIWKLNETAGSYTGETNTPLGTTGSFTVGVADKTASLKTITSTGYIPNSTTPKAKRTIKVEVLISNQSISFHYAVQTLEGGVTMSNSATINGNVYTNGNISAGNGSGQIITGDAYAVGTIDEEPAGPINVQGEAVEGAPSKDAPDITALVDDFKGAAEAGGITNCIDTPAECLINTSRDIGPRKYVNGDLTIANNAIVILKGAIWVENKNFSMSQGGTTLKLDESFGSNGTGIVVDGKVDLTQGGNLQPTTANPKGYIMVISNSTASDAVKISQSGATGIFYVLQGEGKLSQSAHVAALVAKTLTMLQSSTLDYDTGLADARFSTGPGGSWQIKRGSYHFTISP